MCKRLISLHLWSIDLYKRGKEKEKKYIYRCICSFITSNTEKKHCEIRGVVVFFYCCIKYDEDSQNYDALRILDNFHVIRTSDRYSHAY